MSPSAPCSRRWRAQLPVAIPAPTSRKSTDRSGTVEEPVDLPGDLFPLVLLEEVRRAFDHSQLAGAGDVVDETLACLGSEDRVGVGEANEDGLLPGAEPLAHAVHLRHARV